MRPIVYLGLWAGAIALGAVGKAVSKEMRARRERERHDPDRFSDEDVAVLLLAKREQEEKRVRLRKAREQVEAFVAGEPKLKPVT